MKVEDQVCSLEQGLKLKRLRISTDSLFVHDELPFDSGTSVIRLRLNGNQNYSGNPPAFTVAELGVMLPTDCYSYVSDDGKSWFCLKDGDEEKYELYDFTESPTESQARAKRLIELLEAERTTPEEVNNRLNQ